VTSGLVTESPLISPGFACRPRVGIVTALGDTFEVVVDIEATLDELPDFVSRIGCGLGHRVVVVRGKR
jgi:hypothetical protein